MSRLALGRLSALAALFCIVPPLLAMSPGMLAGALPVVIATFLSASLGLLGAHYLGRRAGSVLAVAGFGALAVGPAFAGLSAAALGGLAVALVLEWLLADQRDRTAAAGAGLVVMLVTAASVALSPVPASALGQGGLAAVLLPFAPLVGLCLTMREMQRRLAAGARADLKARQREDIMLAAADVAVALVDKGAHVLDASAEAGRLLMQGPLALDGRGLIDRVLIADRPAFLTAVASAALDGVSQSLRLRLATGLANPANPVPPTFATFDLQIRPAQGVFGEAAIVISRAAEEAASESLLSVAGPGLFSTLSHEIRTPMNAILGFSEILANEALAPRGVAQVAEYASIIHRSARDAFSVTRSVVDLLRVEAGEFTGESENIYLSELIGGVFAHISGREPDGGCSFDIEAALSDDAVVSGEPRAVRMLMSTLVEGLLTAQNHAVDMVCAITSVDGRPAVTINARPRPGIVVTAGKHEALLAVVGVLVRRLAAVTGAEVEFDPPNGARLIFGAAVPVPVRRHRPETPSAAASLIPLRKSA